VIKKKNGRYGTFNDIFELCIFYQVSFQEGREFADKVDAIFLETSALSGTNISELFTQLG